jgi:ferredoxin-NADP reductase
MLQLTFHHAEPLGNTGKLLWFEPASRLRYQAGQFIELYVPHPHTDARGDARMFTLVSAPFEPLLGIALRFPQPGSSFKHTLQELQPGATLHIIGESLGDFVLPKDPGVPMVWVAGGIAAASYVGMTKELAREGAGRSVTLFQSARQASDLVFDDTWRVANLPVQQTVTGDDITWSGRRGRFSANDLLAAAGTARGDTLFYVSGSEQMVDNLCQALLAQGIKSEQLVREAYTGY